MIKKILQEVFGITDELDPITHDRPGGLTYRDSGTTFDGRHGHIDPINPFDPALSATLANINNHNCSFFNITNNKCGVGCKIINVVKDGICPVYESNNLNPPWGTHTCPCYHKSFDLYGRVTRDDKNEKNTYDFNKEDPTNKFDKVKPLTGWQYDIYDAFKKKNTNLIISVPPGGGKTRPIKIYFYEKMLNFLKNRGGEMPRFIYFVPTKQLSIQISNNDFIRDDEYGIMALLGNLQRNSSPSLSQDREQVHNWFQDLLFTQFTSDFERESFMLKFAQSFVVIMSGDNPNPQYEFGPEITSKVPFLRGQIKPIIVCVKGGGLVPTVRKYASQADHIIIDEVQELLTKPGMMISKDDEKQFIQLCQVISAARSANTRVHLLTGSVNENSLFELGKAFESILKVKFEYIPDIFRKVKIETGPDIGKDRHLDASTIKNSASGKVEMPGMKNRSRLTVVPLQAISGENSFKPQVSLIKTIIQTRQTNSILVMFSVRNFAKTSLVNLMIEALKTLPRRPHGHLYDGPAKMDIVLNDLSGTNKYRNSGYLKDIPQYQVNGHPDMARIIGKREANKDIRRYSDYLDSVNLTGKEREEIEKHHTQIPGMIDDKRENIYVDDIEFLKYFNRFELEEDKGDFEDKTGRKQNIEDMTMTKDESNILYQGALAGMGLMIGAMHPIHKDTIQRLFQKGKIYILLATDALGVKFAPSNRNI